VGQQAADVLGYPVKDWLEEGFWIEHLQPEDRLESIEFCQRAVASGGSHQFENRMIAADGATVWLHNVLHVTAEVKLIGFMVDVTERCQAEEKARDYLRQLARVNRASSMGEMATSIAHEVNQPLFAIVSNAQTAKRLLDREQPDIAEVREALGDIVSDGNRASTIIDHVRSRVRNERHTPKQLDLNQIALEAIQFIGPEIRQRGLTMRADLADDLLPVRGNAIELQQVILNLIINGAQSMPGTTDDSSELLLRTSAQNGYVELAVEDRGVGLDEDLADRIFEPFFTTKPQGTGMGLAINRTIIEAHGGRIWATPNDDRGATFHFRLPSMSEAVA
jgi:C4-dicarboxylate-specific signal transduction histidine kinase